MNSECSSYCGIEGMCRAELLESEQMRCYTSIFAEILNLLCCLDRRAMHIRPCMYAGLSVSQPPEGVAVAISGGKTVPRRLKLLHVSHRAERLPDREDARNAVAIGRFVQERVDGRD